MKRHLVEIYLLAAILIAANLILTQGPRSTPAKTAIVANFPTIELSQSEMDDLLALSPHEAADLEKDLAFERAAGGELHVSRFPAQAAN